MTTAVAVATMKAAQVSAAGAGLRIVELEVPDPGPGQVRIKACGVCHSDVIIVEGRRPEGGEAPQESDVLGREEMWPAMNGNNKPAIKPSTSERSQPWTGLSCPECEERSYLRVLVTELLYRNQVLRFDLIEARDQVERIERVGSDRRGDDPRQLTGRFHQSGLAGWAGSQMQRHGCPPEREAAGSRPPW